MLPERYHGVVQISPHSSIAGAICKLTDYYALGRAGVPGGDAPHGHYSGHHSSTVRRCGV